MNSKRIATTLAAVTVASLGLGLAGAQQASALEVLTTANVAHRGYTGWGASQNTNDAFRHAVQKGFDGLEFDVRATKDGRAVILHNTTLDATTTCTGSLRTYTLAKLAACDADNVIGGDFDSVPTYASAMAYIERLSKGTNFAVIVHVKEKLTASFAAGLVKGARSLGNEEARVIFMAEDAANFPILAKAGWDQKDEGRKHQNRTGPATLVETTDVERVFYGVQDVAEVQQALDDSVGAQGYFFYESGILDADDAEVTAERVASIHANGDLVSAEPGHPQTEAALRALRIDAVLMD